MGVLDALTILGSGIGRGYRGSQEIQRQLAEEKRKALLEEREQQVRETTAKSQQALAEAQIQTEAVNRAIGQFGLDVNKKKFETGQAPIAGGAPLKLSFLGNNVQVPGNMSSMTDLSDLIRQLSEEKFKHDNPDFFMNYPPAGTAAAQVKNTPESRGRDYIHTILSGIPPMEITEDADAYNTRVQRLMQAKLKFLQDQDPAALEALFGGSADEDTTTTDEGALDQPAISPKRRGTHKLPPYKGGNRFKVDVK